MDAVVVGAGHNGLIAACHLAQPARHVVVLEQLDRAGGGGTEETIPGYRFDLHSVAHNMINMTDIPAELDLAGAGLGSGDRGGRVARSAGGVVGRCLEELEARAPGSGPSVPGVATHTPDGMERVQRRRAGTLWSSTSPSISWARSGPRGVSAVSARRCSLYVSGAGTNPSGGRLRHPRTVGSPRRAPPLLNDYR